MNRSGACDASTPMTACVRQLDRCTVQLAYGPACRTAWTRTYHGDDSRRVQRQSAHRMKDGYGGFSWEPPPAVVAGEVAGRRRRVSSLSDPPRQDPPRHTRMARDAGPPRRACFSCPYGNGARADRH